MSLTKSVTFRLPVDEAKRLRRLARAEKRQMSSLVREALDSYLTRAARRRRKSIGK